MTLRIHPELTPATPIGDILELVLTLTIFLLVIGILCLVGGFFLMDIHERVGGGASGNRLWRSWRKGWFQLYS